MNDQTKDTGTTAPDTGNADAGAKPAGATAAAPAAAAPKTPKTPKESPPPKAGTEATVVVTGPEKGRWRIGRHFTREPASIPLGDLKKGDLDRLKSDPELFVQVIDAPH